MDNVIRNNVKSTKSGAWPVSLWLPFAALSGWLMCFMRLCFRSVERTGLAYRENTLYICLCAGVVLGMLVPLPDIVKSRKRYQALYRLSAAAAIPCTALAVSTKGSAALAFILLASFFASAAMGCCLYRISLLSGQNGFGWFFGTAFAASEGLLLILLLAPADRVPAAAAVAAVCLLPLIAALTDTLRPNTARADTARPNTARGDTIRPDTEPADVARADTARPDTVPMEAISAGAAERPAEPPSPSMLVKYVLALMLYSVLGGMLDSLTAFADAFIALPHVLAFTYLYSIAANLALGALYRPARWHVPAMAGLLLICAGQALPYFSSISALAAPYLALTMTGVIIMEFLVRSLPARYACGTRRPAAVSRMGYVSLYGGFLIAGLIFEYIPRGRYYFVMGLVLALAIATLALLYTAFSEEGRRRYTRIMSELRALEREKADAAQAGFGRTGFGVIPDIETQMEQKGLSAREKEVCALLLGAYSLKQIALELHVAYGTVNKHNTSIYRKLGINSKAELFRLFGVGDAMVRTTTYTNGQ